jgi:hypothetical protein
MLLQSPIYSNYMSYMQVPGKTQAFTSCNSQINWTKTIRNNYSTLGSNHVVKFLSILDCLWYLSTSLCYCIFTQNSIHILFKNYILHQKKFTTNILFKANLLSYHSSFNCVLLFLDYKLRTDNETLLNKDAGSKTKTPAINYTILSIWFFETIEDLIRSL